jgi:rod shape-determining protein MreC
VAGALVFVSIVLITIYFREPATGGLHGVQSAGAAVLRPFEVATERVARPFRDGYGWFAGLVHAKSENGRLRREADLWRQKAIQNANATTQNTLLQQELHYVRSPRFPTDYDYVATDVISQAPSEFEQQVGIMAGSVNGIRVGDPVVNPDGLVGLVTTVAHNTAEVTLLTDPKLNVSALDAATQATGVVSSGQGRGTLILDRVSKSQVVHAGDQIETQGWRVGNLSSHYPRGIPLGTVSSASVNDVNLYWQVQLNPSVNFGDSLQSVIVLVPKSRPH